MTIPISPRSRGASAAARARRGAIASAHAGGARTPVSRRTSASARTKATAGRAAMGGTWVSPSSTKRWRPQPSPASSPRRPSRQRRSPLCSTSRRSASDRPSSKQCLYGPPSCLHTLCNATAGFLTTFLTYTRVVPRPTPHQALSIFFADTLRKRLELRLTFPTNLYLMGPVSLDPGLPDLNCPDK